MQTLRGGLLISVICWGALTAAAYSQSSNSDASIDALGTNPVAGTVKEGSLDGISVTYVSWGGEIQKGQVAGLEGFLASKAQLIEDSPTDYAKIAAQVMSGNGQWDVVDVEGIWAAANCGKMLLKLDDRIVDRSKLPEGNKGSECSVPVLATGNIFAYDANTYPNAPTTWADFFDVEKFPGKRAVYAGNPTSTLEAALLADGVSSNQLYPLDVDRALAKLDTIKDHLVYWQTGAQSQQMVESNQASMGIFWSGRVMNAVANGANWEPVHDRPLITYDDLVVPNSAPHPVAAMALINYALGAAAQEIVTQKTGYPGSNVDAKPELEPLVAKFQATASPFRDPITLDSAWWAQNIENLTDRWTNWVNG